MATRERSGTRPRVLYVEDDETIADMTMEVLREGNEVVHIVDGESALKSALNEPFDVMIIDRRLPGRDGIALVEAIRTARITTPILLLTALGSIAERVEGLDAGAKRLPHQALRLRRAARARPRTRARLSRRGSPAHDRQLDLRSGIVGTVRPVRRTGLPDGH